MIKLSLLWTLCLFLAPLLLVQGIWIRRRAIRLPEAAGPRSSGDSNDLILVLGDSVVAGVGVERTGDALPAALGAAISARTGKPINWRAIGTNGHRLQDVLDNLGQIQQLEAKPKLIVVNIGVNDVSHLTSLTGWQLQLTTLVSRVKQEIGVPLVLLGLPPMHAFPLLPQPLRFALGVRAKMLDNSLEKISGLLPDVYFLRADLPLEPEYMAVDGYHPSAAGVAKWAQALAEQLVELEVVS